MSLNEFKRASQCSSWQALYAKASLFSFPRGLEATDETLQRPHIHKRTPCTHRDAPSQESRQAEYKQNLPFVL